MPLKVVKVGFTSLSNPKKMTIMKKKLAQSWGNGIRATARGKAMNANPGPIKTMQKKELSYCKSFKQNHFVFLASFTKTSHLIPPPSIYPLLAHLP